MESHTDTGSPSGCENCVLCAASNRAHSLKKCGQAFLDRVRQKGKTGVAYVVQEISERSKRIEEAHPKTSEIMGNIGSKILSVGVVVSETSKRAYHKGVSGAKSAYTFMKSPSIPPAQQVRRFFIQNGISCYFRGGLVLIAGTYLLIPMALSLSSTPGLIICSIWYIFVIIVLVLVPLAYSWLRRPIIELDDSSSQTQVTDKPPLYESLPPACSPLPPASKEGVAPPKYEEAFEGSQALLHDRNGQIVGVPLCDVHRPHEALGGQNVTDTTETLSTSHRLSRSPSCNV